MKFRINYWRNLSGKAPVEEYIDAINNKEEKAKFLSTLIGVQKNGTNAVGIEFRQIRGKLWELKIRSHGNQHWIFYVVFTGSEMILLHAYLKKTPKAPERERKIAEQRLKQLMESKDE